MSEYQLVKFPVLISSNSPFKRIHQAVSRGAGSYNAALLSTIRDLKDGIASQLETNWQGLTIDVHKPIAVLQRADLFTDIFIRPDQLEKRQVTDHEALTIPCTLLHAGKTLDSLACQLRVTFATEGKYLIAGLHVRVPKDVYRKMRYPFSPHDAWICHLAIAEQIRKEGVQLAANHRHLMAHELDLHKAFVDLLRTIESTDEQMQDFETT